MKIERDYALKSSRTYQPTFESYPLGHFREIALK
jgi:hypothetical protein